MLDGYPVERSSFIVFDMEKDPQNSNGGDVHKRRLMILPEGGTILSRVQRNEAGHQIITPSDASEAFAVLKTGVSELTLSRFSQINFFNKPNLIDSSKAMADCHIKDIVQNVRERIAIDEADVFLMMYGTDTMSDLVTALGYGISKEELGDKAVIVTGSMQHLDVEHTDAHINFRQSVELACMQGVRGKIGLCLSNRFFPPRRLKKLQLNKRSPFACGLRRMAKYDEARWMFDRPTKPFDEPMGTKGEAFDLIIGVERIGLTSTSDYSNLARMVKHNQATILEAPGNGNLRTDAKSIQELKNAAKNAKGPLIVVGEAIQDPDAEEDFLDMDWQDAVYEGDASLHEDINKLIPGGPMSESEARIFVSHCLAEAIQAQMGPVEKMQYVRERFLKYPFIDPKNCMWRPANNGF